MHLTLQEYAKQHFLFCGLGIILQYSLGKDSFDSEGVTLRLLESSPFTEDGEDVTINEVAYRNNLL